VTHVTSKAADLAFFPTSKAMGKPAMETNGPPPAGKGLPKKFSYCRHRSGGRGGAPGGRKKRGLFLAREGKGKETVSSRRGKKKGRMLL